MTWWPKGLDPVSKITGKHLTKDRWTKNQEQECEHCHNNPAVYFNVRTNESICQECFDHKLNVLDEKRFKPKEWVVK